MGERLRRARVEKHLTLEEVEETTKIRARYLRALEEEDYGELPEPVFTRGFLRTYARFLGLNPAELLADLRGPEPEPESNSEPTSAPLKGLRGEQRLDQGDGGGRRFWLGMLVIVVLAGVVYEFLGHAGVRPKVHLPSVSKLIHRLKVAPKPVAPTGGPRMAYVGTYVDTNGTTTVDWSVYGSQGLQVNGAFQGDCWVQSTVDGVTDNGTTYVAGQRANWRANQRLVLVLGAASQAHLTVDGQVIGAGGPTTTVRTLIFTDYPAPK